MSEADYQAKLRGFRKHHSVHGAAVCWIDNQLSEMEQEKEKNRSGKRSPLRSRLRNLVMSIIQQNGRTVKGVERNA